MCFLCGGLGGADFEPGVFRVSEFVAPPSVPAAPSSNAPSPEVQSLVGATSLFRWNVETPLGTGVVVTYSFNTARPAYDATPRPGMTAFTEEQKRDVRLALDTWAAAGGIAFVEVPEAVGGQIRFNITDLTGQVNSVGNQLSGFGFFPSYSTMTVDGQSFNTQAYNRLGGDIFVHSGFYANVSGAFAPGQRGYSIMLHEIGHAIGFKHPFEGTPVINPAFDNGAYTVMSYNRPNSTTTLGTVDVEALRYYYGTSVGAWSFDSAQLILTRQGGNGADALMGTELRDILRGGAGNDTLYAGPGSDTLDGGDGFDVVSFRASGAAVEVNLFFGTGNASAFGDVFLDLEAVDGSQFGDLIIGSMADNRLDGFGGSDRLFGGFGRDSILGGTGSDTAFGEDGDDELYGWSGNDSLSGGDGNDRIFGESDADRLFGDAGSDTLDGGDGFDALFGWLGDDRIFAGSGNDTAYGDDGNDLIAGDDGNDLSYGGAGNDTLFGWFGDDTLWGGADADLIYGDDGADRLFGENGNDTLIGNAGQDLIYGWFGADLLWGGDGEDTLRGEQDNDTLLGEAGNDVLLGIEGNDVMYGWTGNDSLYGWFGDDVLWGEAGNDLMLGEDGADVFIGGLGRDTMTGGQGADRFFNANFEMAAGEVDLITDYDAADRYLFQTGAQIQYFNFNAPGIGQSAGIHVQVAGGVFILDVFGATAAQLQAQTQFF